ncbi:hypothetical protein ABKW28_18160 [Nocardioides sp. 31GB23]|uniref:hypothetical protein n=1 Tax=Nocardioides sp. 31GB23 TaxID=3156065 RepID=UPI0032AE8B40
MEDLALEGGVERLGERIVSYDNAMAEALNSLFKAECIRNPVMRPKGGWKSVSDVEIAVAEYTDWSRYAGDPFPGRQDSGGGLPYRSGTPPWSSRRVCCAHLVRAAVS